MRGMKILRKSLSLLLCVGLLCTPMTACHNGKIDQKVGDSLASLSLVDRDQTAITDKNGSITFLPAAGFADLSKELVVAEDKDKLLTRVVQVMRDELTSKGILPQMYANRSGNL